MMQKIFGFGRKAKVEPGHEEQGGNYPVQYELKFKRWPDRSQYKPIVWKDWISDEGSSKRYEATGDFFIYNVNPRECEVGLVTLNFDYCTNKMPRYIIAAPETNLVQILKTFVFNPPVKVMIDDITLTNEDVHSKISSLIERGILKDNSKIWVMCRRFGLFGFYKYG